MLNITEILYKSSWDDFFNQNGSPSFLQSWEWGEFEKKSGYEILRLGIFEKEKLQAISLIIKIKAKRGSFLFIPHGPVFQHSTSNTQYSIKKITSQLLNYLSDIAKKENFSFIRIAPTLLDTSENLKIFSDLGFSKAPIYMHAERLWVLDLNKSEEELLAGMRKTTRYLIKRATRDGVVIEKRSDDKVVNDFNKLYQQTAERENFVPFSKEFIRNEFDSFKKTGNAIFFFGSVPKAFPTPQGASIHTKIPITYALQWEAIKEAKRRGCRFYSFWGILQEGRTPKNWGGLTLFKQGFGGRQVDYLTTQDYIISPKYYITSLYERFLAWR